MFPYYYPTTVAVLDDDPGFLDAFQLRFSEEPLLRTFTDPATLIQDLVTSIDRLPRPDRFLIPHDGDGAAPGDRVLRVDGSAIADLIRVGNRFEQVGVVIIDYDMPTMNGLQVCRALSNLPVRKILLTGKAGVDTGVNALNDGLIDCYVTKQDRNLSQQIRSQIARQRDAYFTHLTKPLQVALGDSEMGFLANPALTDLVRDHYAKSSVVEHYVTVDQPGIVMLTTDGRAIWVLVARREDLASQVQVAQEAGAPQELVSLLDGCRVIPAFPGGFYSEAVTADWRRHLVPARSLADDWFYGVLSSGPILESILDGLVSVDAYLRVAQSS